MASAKPKPKPAPNPPPTRTAKEYFVRYFWNPFIVITVALGGIVTFESFNPRVVITASEPVDITNPFSSTFTITNQSWFDLRKVVFLIGVAQVVGRDSPDQLYPIPEGYSFPSRFTRDDIWRVRRMGSDDQFTLIPADAMRPAEPDGLKAAAFAVIIRYSPSWLWFYRGERIYPFITYKAADGHLHWVATPVP